MSVACHREQLRKERVTRRTFGFLWAYVMLDSAWAAYTGGNWWWLLLTVFALFSAIGNAERVSQITSMLGEKL